MSYENIIKELKSHSNPKCVEGMARFGINPHNTLGVSLPVIRNIAKKTGKDHSLSIRLWDSGIHEARLLASIIGEPERVTEEQMEKWAKDFDSWDIVDICSFLFSKTRFAEKKITEWTRRKEEFVKRMGFVLMCSRAVHDKKASDSTFEKYFKIIKRESKDERNFVKKAVNWALRQIGKRNIRLNKKAIKLAEDIQRMDSKPAKWIASNALAELESEKVKNRLRKK
ncbi:MAG: DNA alkylation repair protein [Candidatus Aenigmarchaeota archaeon]|nr:DNA alkylation repair protein [Candidatus Aenigmarchaeota archaeon]